MIERIIGEGRKRNLSPAAGRIKKILSLLTGLYLLWSVVIYPEPILHRGICFGLFFALTFISYTSPGTEDVKPGNHDSIPFHDIILAVLSFAISVYIAVNLDRLVMRIVYVDSVYPMDMAMCIIAVVLLMEGTRRIVGPWLPLLSILALIYAFYGNNIPGRFGHRGFSVNNIVDTLFLSSNGIWGSTMGIATSHIMTFMIFGAFLIESGAGDFLFDFVTSIAGRTKGGVAKVAILTSALFGMISGSAIANASTTGALTIPMMKKKGYPPVYAASLESCASVGGCFMPPIMGSVAFMMAEVVGIPYYKIAIAAFIPALIYFSALFFTVDIISRKLNLEGNAYGEKMDFIKIFKGGFTFFIPLLYLILRLSMGISPSRVGLESIILIVVICIPTANRFTLEKLSKGLVSGVEKGLMIVTTMATCGILIGIINATGIAAKFSSLLISLAGFSTVGTLIFVMLLAIFLGLAMNITSSYLLTAVICAPILVKAGYQPLSVHMFIMFFSAMATITPPVALTSFAAASIAGAPPMETGFRSMKAGIAAYILPFIFVFNPAILLIGKWYQTAGVFMISLAGVFMVALGMEGWWLDRRTGFIYRAAIISSGFLLISGNQAMMAASMVIVALIYLYFRNKERIHGVAASNPEKTTSKNLED